MPISKDPNDDQKIMANSIEKSLVGKHSVCFLNHTGKLGEEFVLPFFPLPCIYLNLLFHSFSKYLFAFLTIKEQDKNFQSTDEGEKISHKKKLRSKEFFK